MPLFEFACSNEECQVYARIFERYLSRSEKPDPQCPECGGKTVRMISSFAIALSGNITSKYNDPKKPDAHEEGMVLQRVKSTTREDGKPESVYIDTHQKLREFCKAEGLVNPKYAPAHMEISADGKKVSTGRGFAGQWV